LPTVWFPGGTQPTTDRSNDTFLVGETKVREVFFLKGYHPIPWWDSISRPMAPVSSVVGGDDTPSPLRQGK
jgi:hypothetical protein